MIIQGELNLEKGWEALEPFYWKFKKKLGVSAKKNNI